MTSSSAATDSEKDKPSAPVVGELGDAIADSELRQLFEAVTESLHHKVDPELMRSVSSQEVELSADSTLFDVITSRASLLGIRMTRLPVTPFEVVTMPMHQLPLVVERADGGLGVVNATRAFRARVRWEDNEAWLGPKALATWLGASNDRERVIAMDAELALPLTGRERTMTGTAAGMATATAASSGSSRSCSSSEAISSRCSSTPSSSASRPSSCPSRCRPS
jgi:hypothetical protein